MRTPHNWSGEGVCEACWERAALDVQLLGGSQVSRYHIRLSESESERPAVPSEEEK